MATSGSFNTNKVGEFYATVSWTRTGYSATNNEHYISYSVVAHNTAGKYRTVYIKELTINGNKVYNAPSGTSYYNNNTITSGTITISSSNSAGDGSITMSFRAGVGTSQSYNMSGSGTWDLDRIPRYATVTQTFVNKTETQITMNWKTDSTVDGVWYSINGGSSWVGGLSTGTGTSGNYTITGLTANTTYNIQTRVKRKDSQLYSNTSSTSIQTYNYPYCTSTPNFTIGDTLTLPIYNPMARSVKVYIISNSQTNGGDLIAGTSISGYNNSSWQNWWYARIPNSRSSTYQVKVVYGSIEKTTSSSGTYTINTDNCLPTIGTTACIDNNASSVAITGDDTNIVQYMSNLHFNFNNLSAKNSATLTSLKVSIGGVAVSGTISNTSGSVDYGHISQSGTVEATVEITDSRNLRAMSVVNVNVTEYIIPNAIISLSRKSNFYEESYIKVNADYSQIGSNAITIRYCMKQSGQADSQYSAWTSLSDNVQATFNADNNVSWDIWVQIYDTFVQTIGSPSGGNAINYYRTLPRGIPLTFYDEYNNSVGFNCFPDRLNAVLSTGLPIDDIVQIGSQVIIDSFTQSSSGTGVVAKCFNYDMIQNLFDGVYIPPSYERAYRLMANVGSVGDNNYGYLSLNNIQSRPVRTMYSNYWKSTKISSSRIFKESEITLQNVSILGQTSYKGLQLSATSNDGSCNFYDITIQGYLVKQSTDLSDVTPEVPTTLENTALLTLHRVVCDYMIANYGYANAQAVDNAFTFTYYGTSYQGIATTPIYTVELKQSNTVKYTFTCNVVSEAVIDVVVS